MEDDSDLDFEDIAFEKFKELPGEEEDDISLEALKKSLQPQQKVPTVPTRPPQPAVSSKPVVVEDFIRNYLKKMKMEKTLNCFQVCFYLPLQFIPVFYYLSMNIIFKTEWYENAFDSTTDPVVDAYAQIQQLTEQVFRLKEELQAKSEFAEFVK